jgi:hypothetical protein
VLIGRRTRLTLRQFRASPVGLLCGSMRKAKRRRWLPLLDLTMSGVGPLADIAQPGWDRPPLPYKIQTRSCVGEYSGKYAIRIGYPELTAISR